MTNVKKYLAVKTIAFSSHSIMPESVIVDVVSRVPEKVAEEQWEIFKKDNSKANACWNAIVSACAKEERNEII